MEMNGITDRMNLYEIEVHFCGLTFGIGNGKIRLKDAFGFRCANAQTSELNVLAEIQLAGAFRGASLGAKQILTSEGEKLRYVSHVQEENRLIICQRDESIEVKTVYEALGKAIRVRHIVKNISKEEIVLENAPALLLYGLSGGGTADTKNVFLYRFYNSWHVECQPRKSSLFELGLFCGGPPASKKRVSGVNIGSWSSKEEIPQAIIEDGGRGLFFMFQIENSGSWYWEIGECEREIYLLAGGPNRVFGQWSRKLAAGETFESVPVAFTAANTLNGVLGKMTEYRRRIAPKPVCDENLPVIFNEYMHLSWDNPSEERTKKIAPLAAEMGAEYYVIDCGWHDEEASVYNYVGKWKESKTRFPSGIKATADYLRSFGLKPGLWIETESFGYLCSGMETVYDDSCFFVRNGKAVINMGRKQLDFRQEKVRNYVGGVLRRMIEEYGAEYIKIDYNQDCGEGTELNCCAPGDGLLEHSRAYLAWLKEITERYPHVLIENCGSGGCRMDYAMLSVHPLQSTSDQVDYRNYPYIAGNMLSAVLPEQAGVWSYPCAGENFDDEVVVFNMVNSFLGRIHLASDLRKLTEEQKELVKEGVKYYRRLTPYKKTALPYLPLGFTDFGSDFVASGLLSGKNLFLAVWNLGRTGTIGVPLRDISVKSVRMGYPKGARFETPFECGEDELTLTFREPYRARFLELELN